ncbi:molybdotransferase-like divisome protein Glp [Pengzhenrongella frigida]|uniref:Molybdopterin molybdenumtransferase n=1 Tax=Pengzhenrongella frigida TaxID=1259133 RepID=A0A4Q5MZH0_9MICO|nr:gephyrin-like molybdotransferase Glp [Cellulomonas sp. HLT2-17]RYV51158.1 molybdopterin molybdenumtransferase MoeA [Cellulomonas sp. HLT2-17]
MKSVDRHLEDLLAGVAPLEAVAVDFLEALGAVLAQDVVSQVDLPVFDNSAMDGYAVQRADLEGATELDPVVLAVVGDVAAGAVAPPATPGAVVRVMTGAPVPVGADAVVPVEWTDGGTDRVSITRQPAARANIRPRADDVTRGEVVLRRGTEVDPTGIGLISSVGPGVATVHRRPHVLVLSTGSELVPPGSQLGPAQIFDSNSLMLAAAVRQAGGTVRRLAAVHDDPAVLLQVLADALPGVDLVITSGGISVGAYDVVKAALGGLGTVTFEQVAMQPGKPQGHGVLGPDRTRVITLPGNPVSAYVSFQVFVRPVLRRMLGHDEVERPIVPARLLAAMTSPVGRRQFVRAHVEIVAGERVVRPVGGAGSHLVGALARSNALIVVPELTGRVETGEQVAVMITEAGSW